VTSHSIKPADYSAADIAALQELEAGVASPDQQKRALKWIIEQACITYDLSFDPTSERTTSFAEGRRYVGLQIVKMLKLNRNAFKEK